MPSFLAPLLVNGRAVVGGTIPTFGLVSPVGAVVNKKYSKVSAPFDAHLLANLPSAALCGNIREGVEGGPGSTAGTPKPSATVWDNAVATGGGLKWYADMVSAAWFSGRRMLAQPRIDEAYEGTPAYGTDWKDNMAWRMAQTARVLPWVSGWLWTNEPDLLAPPSAGFNFTRDGETTKAVLTERLMSLGRAISDVVAGRSSYLPGGHTGYILGPCLARTQPDSNPGVYTNWDLAQYNNGEIIGLIHGWQSHQHREQQVPTGWNGEAVGGGSGSFYHLWTARNEANRLRATLAGGSHAPRLIPVCSTESGVGLTQDVGAYADRELLKAYKLGQQWIGYHWYAVSMYMNYAMQLSGAPPDYNFFTDALASRSFTSPAGTSTLWEEWKKITNIETHDINSFSGTIPAKSYWQFGYFYDWGILARMDSPNPISSSGNPFGEWQASRVEMPGGSIILKAASGGVRNTAAKIIYLREVRPYRLQFDVAITGSAQMRLRARGYDNTDGLAEVTDTTSSSRTLSVTFTPKRHESHAGIPDPMRVVFAGDMLSSGDGTCTITNHSITPL